MKQAKNGQYHSIFLYKSALNFEVIFAYDEIDELML